MATYPWDMRRDITSRELVDELRMPRIYGDTWGDPAGMVDPAALTALSQGGPYDIQARRNAIAKRLLDNQLAQQIAQFAPTPDQLMTMPNDYRLGGSGDYGMGAGDTSLGVSAGDVGAAAGPTAGQGTQSFGDMIGGQPSGFMSGAPPGPSMFGSSDRAAPGFTEGGAMTTSNASMVGDPMGESTAQPASVFGREGDTSHPSSQGIRESQAQDFAMSAFGRESMTDRSQTAPGWGRGGADDREGISLADVAQAAQAAPAPSAYGSSTFNQPGATPVSTVSFTNPNAPPGSPFTGRGGGKEGFGEIADYAPTPDRDDFGNVISFHPDYDPDAPDVTPQPTPTPTPTPTPSLVATNTPTGRTPTGRTAFAPSPTPTGRTAFAPSPTPDAITGPGVSPTGGGFGGFSESSPGGYAGGPGMTTGFGAGYSGSSDFGNTQGAQGFTTGGFSSGSAQGFSTGGFEGGAPAGTDPGSGGIGGGGDTGGGGGSGGGGGGSSGGSDPGGSPGGVG